MTILRILVGAVLCGEVCLGQLNGGNDEPLISICSLGEGTTEALLIDSLSPCASTSTSCEENTECVSGVVASLTQESPCDDRIPMSGGFCNRAGTALVLVETLRKVAEAALRDQGAHHCPQLALLTALFLPCKPQAIDEGTLSYYRSLKVDAYGMVAYQTLMRGVGDRLKHDDGIAAEMRWVEEQRLWRGAAAIGFSFACPGIVALVSPSHLPMVVTVEILGATVMLVYVWALHGLWLALGSLGVCTGVFVAQMGLLLIRRRLFPPDDHPDHCPASPRLKHHHH